MASEVDCYDVPEYWDLAFGEDTVAEAEFVVAAVAKYCDFELRSLVEPGCGGGRLVVELARRGFHVTGWDNSEIAAAYANRRLQAEGLPGGVIVQDMRSGRMSEPVDVAYCLVNTFRHLLTEDEARGHLQNIAASVRPGGLYIIGMHLLPPDADEEDEEEWTMTEGGTTVGIHLTVEDCDRQKREEVLRFSMTVDAPKHEEIQTFTSDYRMRTYEAADIRSLFGSVPEFRLLDVYDFWYDIDEPLTLSDELGDTVFVLQRQ